MEGFGVGAAAACHPAPGCSPRMSSGPGHKISERSMKFCSSRTVPGQS